MTENQGRLQRLVHRLRATPLHPQWLLGTRKGMAREIARHARGQVLDIGCADRWVQSILPHSCVYIGVDYLATGAAIYQASPDVFADASSLPIADDAVDTVVMLEVLEHVSRPRAALVEVARVLRSGGKLLLSIPFLYPVHDAPHDYQRFTIHGLARELEAAGLRIEKISPSLGAAETAGLLASLALGGMATQAMRGRRPGIVLVPLLVAAIPLVNLLAWLGERWLPPWDALTSGYEVLASKP